MSALGATPEQRTIVRSLYAHRCDLIRKGLKPRYAVLDQATYLALTLESGHQCWAIFGLPIVVIPGIPELCAVVADPWDEARRGVDMTASTDIPS